jgi:hypothetical protein
VALRDGLLAALFFTAPLFAIFWYDPWILLNPGDMPADIDAAADPKTGEQRRLSIRLGIPALIALIAGPVLSAWLVARAGEARFLALSLHALVVVLFVFFWDLLVLDLLLFCTVTPKFMVVSGTERGSPATITRYSTFACTPGRSPSCSWWRRWLLSSRA